MRLFNLPMARMAVGLVAGLLLLVATVGGAAAARPALILINIDLDTGTETFTTDSPLLCPSGVAFTDFHFGAGNFNQAGTFHLAKLLVCDDSSGSFVIGVNAGENFNAGTGTTGGWFVVPGSGTDAYWGLQGGGNVVGVNGDNDPIDLTDHYYGSLTL
jgi:hypothetical protein